MRPPDPREERPHLIVHAVRQLAEGRSNAAGQVTLTAGAGSTLVSSAVIPPGCYPQLTPASASAAAEWAAGTIHVGAVEKGGFTIFHANSADETRIVNWYAVGG